MDLRLLYITANTADEARRIGRTLTEEHLVACVNILPHASSFYFLKGKLEEGMETVLIAKTRAALVSKCIERVKALHSYKCPCIVTLPILEGNPQYLAWVAEETKDTS